MRQRQQTPGPFMFENLPRDVEDGVRAVAIRRGLSSETILTPCMFSGFENTRGVESGADASKAAHYIAFDLERGPLRTFIDKSSPPAGNVWAKFERLRLAYSLLAHIGVEVG